jgi:glycosyltransferase involved in cell wall biosynthesis
MARVLIGIPTLNRPDLVRETVRSVVAQGFTDWRAIVSDNVSAGDAAGCVRQWVGELGDPRVTFHQQAENGGEYGQGRFFFAQAQAGGEEYMVILHDDDVLEPGYLAAAVEALTADPGCAFFVCNPWIIDERGERREDFTRNFDERWGRTGVAEGSIDVLDTHMRTGFTPITGAFFSVAALRDSGFVDEDLAGCFPFESNVFLRLGERGARAWFTPRRLFGLRWHSQQMINWGFLNDEAIVTSTIRLFERRRFEGDNERRRCQLLGRLHRVGALHRAQAGDHPGARRAAVAAIRANPASFRTWVIGPATFVAPSLVGAIVRAHFGPRTFSSC